MTVETMGSLNAEAAAPAETGTGSQTDNHQDKGEPTKSRPDPATLIRTLAALLPPRVLVPQQGRPRQPLKLGFHKDAIELGLITPLEASIAFRWYCGSRMYLVACVEGAVRIDFAGQPAGSVTADEAAHAAARLADLDARNAAKAATALAAVKAKREAKHAKRAEEAAAWIAERRAARTVTDTSKGPRPYHQATSPKASPAPPLPTGQPPRRDGLAALRAAAQARKAAASVEVR